MVTSLADGTIEPFDNHSLFPPIVSQHLKAALRHARRSEPEALGGGIPDIAAAGEDPRRPGHPIIAKPAHNGGAAVRGQRNRAALPRISDRAGADQFVALLRPDSAAAGEDPRRPGLGNRRQVRPR